jgi:4a-hydroxytetrahydrobiopterin dehydratase
MARDPRLSKEAAELELDRLEGWSLSPDGKQIEREVECLSFARAVLLLNSVAFLAEGMDHHPDVDLRFRKLKLRLSTHDSGGLTWRDFALAGEVDRLVRTQEEAAGSGTDSA